MAKAKVLDNGMTWNPFMLTKKEYNKLAKIYPDIKKYYPWREASTQRPAIQFKPAAPIATEIRYLARRYGVGQARVIRAMLEALKENNITLDLQR